MTFRLDRPITIERLSEGAQNALNEPSRQWNEHCKEWAQKTDISDVEKIRAGQEYSTLTSRFVVRSSKYTRTITTEDRISYSGKWGILGVKELDRNRYIEITAMRRSD